MSRFSITAPGVSTRIGPLGSRGVPAGTPVLSGPGLAALQSAGRTLPASSVRVGRCSAPLHATADKAISELTRDTILVAIIAAPEPIVTQNEISTNEHSPSSGARRFEPRPPRGALDSSPRLPR